MSPREPSEEALKVVNAWYPKLGHLGGRHTEPKTKSEMGRVQSGREAEWEKVARGTDGRVYPWGNTAGSTRANYGGTGGPTPVGSHPTGASPYGILDMAGNVWEWARSLWGTDFLAPAFGCPYQPADGQESFDAPDSVLRVWRGGSFNYSVTHVRSAVRLRNNPGNRFEFIGFRVVVSPPSP